MNFRIFILRENYFEYKQKAPMIDFVGAFCLSIHSVSPSPNHPLQSRRNAIMYLGQGFVQAERPIPSRVISFEF